MEYTRRVQEPALRPAPVARRWSSLGILLGAGALVAVTTMVPWGGECGFRFVLGAPCPGCGMTRAMAALLRGDLPASLRWHPLALPLALAAAGALALALNEGITGRPTFRRAADRWGLPATVACFVLLAAVWAARVVLHPAWSPDPIRPGSLAARLLE